MPSNLDSEFPKITFEKAELAWSLQKECPELWAQLQKVDPAAVDMYGRCELQTHAPIANELAPFDEKGSVRPRGSKRAFYLRAKSGSVMTVKGSEIRSTQMTAELQSTRLLRKSVRPWTTVENFLFREQKLPYAVSFGEAIEEAQISMNYQLAHFQAFKELAMTPVPLAVYKWSEKVTKQYYETILPFLSDRAKTLSDMILKERGLATYIYYYPHAPFRISFLTPDSSKDYKERQEKMANVANVEHRCNPVSAVENYLELATRMLMLRYSPLTFDSYGCGQCISAQNVTVQGGVVDMDSMIPFKDIKSDREFYELFACTLVVLTCTVRAFLVSPLPYIKFEYEDPSTLSTLISSFVWEKLRQNYQKLNKHVQVDPRLKLLLEKDAGLRLDSILTSLYPPGSWVAPSKHSGSFERGGNRPTLDDRA